MLTNPKIQAECRSESCTLCGADIETNIHLEKGSQILGQNLIYFFIIYFGYIGKKIVLDFFSTFKKL